LAAQLLQALSSVQVLKDVEKRLGLIHRFVLRKANLELCIHTANVENIEGKVCDRLDMLSNALRLEFDDYETLPTQLPAEAFQRFIYQAYFTVPSRTNQVVESFLGVPFAHADYPTLSIVAELMSTLFLHREVREKGGAYGTGVVTDPHKGTITLYSQNDPRSLQTFVGFEKAITQCAQGLFE